MQPAGIRTADEGVALSVGPCKAALVDDECLIADSQASHIKIFPALDYVAFRWRFGTDFGFGSTRFRRLTRQNVAADGLQLLATGAARPGCRYNLNYSQGPNLLIPHVAELHDLTRIVCAVARVQSADRDPAAWDSALTALRLANALQHEPLLISQLTRVALFHKANDTIRILAAQSCPTPDQQAQLDALLQSCDDRAPLVQAMDGERILFGDWAFRHLSRADLRPGMGTPWTLPAAIFFPPLFHLDHAVYLRTLHDAALRAQRPFDAVAARSGEESDAFHAVPKYCVLTRLCVPVLSRTRQQFAVMSAESRVTRTGLAILRQRQQKGGWPASLAELGSASLADPFSGQALVYHVDPTGFTIGSVGFDRHNDGDTMVWHLNATVP